MKTFLLTAIVSLLCVASLAAAQVATIDTRGHDPTSPSVRITGGTGSGASAAASQVLQLKFSLPDFANLVEGQSFDYELAVTNKSNKPILLPESMSWSEVEDSTEREQQYQELDSSLAVLSEDGSRGTIDGHLALYGRESKPATMITVKPGESVRILGSAPFAPVWDRPPSPGTGMHMLAYLAVNSARLRPKSQQADHFWDEERQLYRATSQNEIDVVFQAAQ